MAKKGQKFHKCHRCGKAFGYANHAKCELADMPEVPEKGSHWRRMWLYWYCGAEKTLPSLLAEKFNIKLTSVDPAIAPTLKRQTWDISQDDLDTLLGFLPQRYVQEAS